MTNVPVFLAGVLVLLLCVRLVAQRMSKSDRLISADDFLRARDVLDSVLIKTAAIKKILSTDDLTFISRSGSPDLRRLFLKERKALALHWLRTIQKQVSSLWDIHLRLAAHTSPSVARELEVSFQYAIFLAASNTVLALFWLFGPFKTKSAATYFMQVVENVFDTLKSHLGAIDPSNVGSHKSLVH